MKYFFLMNLFLLFIIINCNFTPIQIDKVLDYDKIVNQLKSISDGQEIILPAGKIIVDKPIIINKNIRIKGAGIDKTIIYSNINKESTAALTIYCTNDNPFQVSDITFEGADKTSNNKSISIQLIGSSKKFRINNCKFIGGGWYAIRTLGDIYGVIDNCKFIDPPKENIFIGDISPGNDSWSRGVQLGSANAVYVEDCYFNFDTVGDNAICSNIGARYVFRHNIIKSKKDLNSCQIDAHGNWNSGTRGTLYVEIYENTLISEHSYYGMHIRGGAGVIYDNTFTGDYTNPIALNNYRAWNDSSTWNPPGTVDDDKINNLYIWNNKINNSIVNIWIYPGAISTIIEGVDYFITPYSYTKYQYPHNLRTELN